MFSSTMVLIRLCRRLLLCMLIVFLSSIKDHELCKAALPFTHTFLSLVLCLLPNSSKDLPRPGHGRTGKDHITFIGWLISSCSCDLWYWIWTGSYFDFSNFVERSDLMISCLQWTRRGKPISMDLRYSAESWKLILDTPWYPLQVNNLLCTYVFTLGKKRI